MSFPVALRYGLFALVVGSSLLGSPFPGSLFLVSPAPASAQQSGTAVHGTVADPTGAVIPGATVTLTPAAGKAIVGTADYVSPEQARSAHEPEWTCRMFCPNCGPLPQTAQRFAMGYPLSYRGRCRRRDRVS